MRTCPHMHAVYVTHLRRLAISSLAYVVSRREIYDGVGHVCADFADEMREKLDGDIWFSTTWHEYGMYFFVLKSEADVQAAISEFSFIANHRLRPRITEKLRAVSVPNVSCDVCSSTLDLAVCTQRLRLSSR